MTAATRWSPMQEAVFSWATTGHGSAIVEAVAGSGKTTTLVELVRRVAGPGRSLAFVAYNKAIAAEITTRVAGLPGVRASTFHALGYGAWMKANPGCRIEDRKVKNLLATPALGVPEPYHEFVAELVSLAKGHALGVLSPLDSLDAWYALVEHHELEELLSDTSPTDATLGAVVGSGIQYAQSVLKASIAQDPTVIDYDDMLYAPLIHNLRMWENDWVLVDEAQDTNPARRALARKILKRNGRLVAVGDPHQAIYGFTGADADALDRIQREFACTRLPLTVTYRCPKAVVALARTWVSHIEAHASAPEGTVSSTTLPEFTAHPDRLVPADAILCRNTKPLVELAFALIRRGVACHVEGKDIGRGLAALATKWKMKAAAPMIERLLAWRENEVTRLNAKGQEQKADSLSDRVDTLAVIAEGKTTVLEILSAIERLFGDTKAGTPSKTVTLATIHKAKGREWDRVYLLGRNLYMPSKFARQEWQLGQEANLAYVAVTRAKATLIDIVVSPRRTDA